MKRKLKDYEWELKGKVVWLYSKEDQSLFALDKVRLMSFIKFAINCLDKMRIEESREVRAKMRGLREKTIKRVKKLEAKQRALKNQQSLFARGKKTKS